MGNTRNVIFKKSDTSLEVPTNSQISEGDLAFNMPDKRIYSNFSGDIVELVTGEYAYTSSNFDSDLSSKSTDDLSEGSSLYFTEQRARDSISASGDLSYSSATGVFSFNETYSSASEIKVAYESNTNTNAFTDAEKSKLLDVKSMANRDVFISDVAPQSSDGNDGDIWFQY